MDLAQFTLPLLGGLLIGISATIMLLLLGRISGISGIYWSAITANADRFWRWAFILGLPIGAFLFHAVSNNPVPLPHDSNILAVVGGLCVGIGVKLGSGCTSGHGVCGIARLSLRSIVATLAFMAAGVISVFVMRHIIQ